MIIKREADVQVDLATFLWDGDNINELKNTYWISRSVTIKALDPTTRPLLQIDIVIAKTTPTARAIDVHFLNIAFTGYIFIGDASVVFENCTLSSCVIEQEYQRRQTSDFITLQIINCLIVNSTIVFAPTNRPNYELNLAEVSIQHSTFQNTLVNVSCVTANVYLNDVLLRGFSESVLSVNRRSTISKYPVGLYVYTGVIYTNDTNVNMTTEEVPNTLSTIRIKNSQFESLYQVTFRYIVTF